MSFFFFFHPRLSILVPRASILLVRVGDRSLTLTKRIEALGTRMTFSGTHLRTVRTGSYAPE